MAPNTIVPVRRPQLALKCIILAGVTIAAAPATADSLGLKAWLDNTAAVDIDSLHRTQGQTALLLEGAHRSLQQQRSQPKGWVTVSIDPNKKGIGIPTTFLGISHEWTNVEELNHGGTYQQLLQGLTAYGSGPLVLRVGGGSTDKQTAPPSKKTLDALKKLQYATGMMFIFGLNFLSGDTKLARSQMDAIWAYLPGYSVMSFELGNEPNYYHNKNGRSAKDYLNCCFVNDWGAFAKAVSCPKGTSSCVNGQLAGPVWGHVNLGPETLDWFLRVNYRWVNFVTVHWYKATSETYNTVNSLLDEGPIRKEMANLKQLVQVSRRYGKNLRVAEMNTISNSGRRGVSNSLAGALWTLDGAFEVAATGAVGINLHWGSGNSLYAALLRMNSGTSIVKPSYYAYLMFQMALGAGASFIDGVNVQATKGTSIKVWTLQDNKSGAVRVVLINKHASAATGVSVRLLDAGFGHGKLLRLVGKSGLSDEWGVSLGGVTFSLEGKSFSTPTGEAVYKQNLGRTSQNSARGFPLQYSVYMPAGSAALLTIPRD